MAKNVRLKIYPAVIGVLGLCAVVLLMSVLEIKVERIPTDQPATSDPESLPNPPSTAPEPSLSPFPTPLPSPAVTGSPPVTAPSSGEGQARGQVSSGLGQLRVSNQTEHPVRVALLPQTKDADPGSGAIDSPSKDSGYNQPVHWDFAPGEGNLKGLLLSMPNGELKLETGDVLVAFAQDGSRRYWGPYVLGKTAVPTWDGTAKEWQLVLTP